MLKKLGPKLVSIHGQHESYELLSPEVHMTYLDSFGELEQLLREYQEAYRSLRKIQTKLDTFRTDEGEKARKIDLLRYQIDEIEAAGVQPGEQEMLTRERDAIRNSEKISASIEMVKGLLSGDENSQGLLPGADAGSAELEKHAPYLPELGDAAQKLQEAGYMLEDADGILRDISVDLIRSGWRRWKSGWICIL